MNTSNRSDIFTKDNIAEYMIYEAIHARLGDIAIAQLNILDPCCGKGAFIFPILKLLTKDIQSGHCTWEDKRLNSFLTAIDINESYLNELKPKVLSYLITLSCPENRALELSNAWFLHQDFLKFNTDLSYDIIIGNPPYIRYDNLTSDQQTYYSNHYHTFSGRSDIYVPFFEHALEMLKPTGCLCYICTNRFTKTSYGKRLRTLISNKYHVRLYLNMEHTQPFETEVSAYPAIFLIDNAQGTSTFAATIDDLSDHTLNKVHLNTQSEESILVKFDQWFSHGQPWLFTSLENQIENDILSAFPTIGESSQDIHLGIGIATGADDIFIHCGMPPEIDETHLLPLAISNDLRSGSIQWSEHYLISPYNPTTNQLYNLNDISDLNTYFEKNRNALASRHCAKKSPSQWYRTIDKVSYPLLKKKKLLIPDIQTGGCVAFDEKGIYYPHHNVYWITSDTWNLFALCVILRSDFVTSQVRMLSPQLRGGSLRYQAQVLRNVRIPRISQLSGAQILQLEQLYYEPNLTKVNEYVDTMLQALRSVSDQPSAPVCAPRQLKLFA